MKINHTQIKHSAILGVLAVALSTSVIFAEPPENKPAEDIENKDPFKQVELKLVVISDDATAEMLDAHARNLFARGEKEEAIKVQRQAVDKAKDNVAKFTEVLNLYIGKPNGDDPQLLEINNKLRGIIIPKVDFEGRSVWECLEFARARAAELDTAEQDPDKKGFNVLLINKSNIEIKPVILSLRNVPVGTLLKYISQSAGLEMRVEPHAVILETPAH